MYSRIVKRIQLEKRISELDNLGWKLNKLAITEREDEFKARWAFRNSNRIYKLLRGNGKPFK